jgi:uncharacterized FlaG/YvyC family protein
METEAATGNPEHGATADESYLVAKLEHAQDVALANTTTLSFERDAEDGRMYIHVRDKRTGEVLYRIPRNYLKDADPTLRPEHHVDLRI